VYDARVEIKASCTEVHMKKLFVIITFLAITLLVSCSNDSAMVTSENGLHFREKPDVKSSIICTIPEKGIVEVLYDEGPIETIKGTEGRWRHVKFGEEKGWVFGPYLSKDIPAGMKAEVSYFSIANSTAFIYLHLKENNDFYLYMENLLSKKREKVLFPGTWSMKKGAYHLKFRCSDPENISALFFQDGEQKWDPNIFMENRCTYAFDNDLETITIWGVVCSKK